MDTMEHHGRDLYLNTVWYQTGKLADEAEYTKHLHLCFGFLGSNFEDCMALNSKFLTSLDSGKFLAPIDPDEEFLALLALNDSASL